MSFTKRVLQISDQLKSWMHSTFEPKGKIHDDRYYTEEEVDNLLRTISHMPGGDLPDFSRAVFMERNIDDYSITPGTIYKINVPGYIYAFSNYGGYTSALDYYFKVAAHPAALYRHSTQASNYGSYARPAYTTERCVLYGDVTGVWQSQHAYPVVPGLNTYVRCCNATSNTTYDFIYFVPCKAVSTSYKSENFITRVGRGENHISTGDAEGMITSVGASAFAGDWRDLFDKNYNLLTNKITYCDETYYTAGNWFDEYRWYLTDPKATGYNRVYFTSSGTYIIKYVSSSVVDSFYSQLTADGQRRANLMRDQWCCVHHNWDAMNAANKVAYFYFCSKNAHATDFPTGLDSSVRPGESKNWIFPNHPTTSYYIGIQRVDNKTGQAYDSSGSLVNITY